MSDLSRSGELLALLAAMFYACAIILTDRLSHKDDPLTLGILQVGFMGIFNAAASVLSESPVLPSQPGWLFLGERLNLPGILGMGLILLGMFFSKIYDRFTGRRENS